MVTPGKDARIHLSKVLVGEIQSKNAAGTSWFNKSVFRFSKLT